MARNSGWLAVCLLAAGCASVGEPTLRGAATDLPERFVLLDAASGATGPVPADAACESPLVDPRDGTRLQLERADGGFGDYAPAQPRYGLAADELLRVDCRTGAASGRVSR